MAEATRVVHVDRDQHEIYIGRPVPRRGFRGSEWRNPFRIDKEGTREEVIERFRTYIQTRADLLERIGELRGKILGCWCAPPDGVTAADALVCHGQVLAALADGEGKHA